jgi:SAM-dependent methyltransferase
MPAPHPSSSRHERQRQLAFALHDRGDYRAAKTAVQSYLRAKPGDPSAVNLLAALHHRLGDSDSAIRLLRPLADKAQLPAFNRAVMLLECGRTADAEQQLLDLGCDILATDLSSRSLAYAQQKADEFGLRNIRFAQADILQLASWPQRFDVILSSGVLHHMHDTLHAWRILRDRLDEGGVMHVALYSRLARTGVNVVREAIAREAQLDPDRWHRYDSATRRPSG